MYRKENRSQHHDMFIVEIQDWANILKPISKIQNITNRKIT